MRKATFGVDNIKDSKHKQFLIVYDSTLSENSKEKLLNYAVSRGIRCELLGFSLVDLTKKDNIKAIAIGDKSLANAIITELDGGAK